MKPKGHTEIKKPKVGVLLINLGTPEGTTFIPMWKYLREFLSDQRVIELSRLIWLPILYLIILITRPKKSGKLYEKIWNKKKDESPLRVFSKSICNKIKQKFNKNDLLFSYAMNYGSPTISKEIFKLFNQGCQRILIFPMYPQYSATTTASVVDNVSSVLKKMRWQPTVRFCPPYYDDKIYIDALVSHIKKNISKTNKKKRMIVASFHGIPKKYFLKGDPYHCHCAKTVRLLNEGLKKEKTNLEISFQSRFGPEEWLRPYMSEKFDQLLEKGETNLIMIAPGFAVDCLETLEEIKIQGKEEFLSKGGESFQYIDCLNDSDLSISMIEKLIKRELSGWIK